VLAPAPRLARGRRLAPLAPDLARPAGRSPAARLVAGSGGQCQYPREKRGPGTGPNPTDRDKAGLKRHVLTDRQGIPLALALTPANVPESRVLSVLLAAVEPVHGPRGRPRRRPANLHADKGYDYPRCHAALHTARMLDRIARRGIESKHRLGPVRWVVEHTLAQFTKFRRLEHCYEWRVDIQPAFHDLAAGLICWSCLHWFC
jgi:transposase